MALVSYWPYMPTMVFHHYTPTLLEYIPNQFSTPITKNIFLNSKNKKHFFEPKKKNGSFFQIESSCCTML